MTIYASRCLECGWLLTDQEQIERHDHHRMVVKVGENQWVAANEGGWTNGIYATEEEAWEAAKGDME